MSNLDHNQTTNNRRSLGDQLMPYPGAVLWDWDGVVVDTISVHVKSISYIMESEGLSFDYQYYRELIGRKDKEIIELIVRRADPDIHEEKVEEIFLMHQNSYKELVDKGHVQPFPGVEKWVKYFQQNKIPQIIASSTTRENIDLVFSQLSFCNSFIGVISGSPNVRGKPEPDIFLLSSNVLGVTPQDCLVIEDTALGIKAAKRAGMVCIGITNTWPKEYLKEADLIVESLADLSPENLFIRKI
jgi:beta-phosphoglucomutase